MDLNSVRSFETPNSRNQLRALDPGDAWLAGGTWLFSEPQPGLMRLIDLSALGWPPIEVTEAGLLLAATCTVATLEAFPYPCDWRAAPLIAECCNAFLASFKIWNTATVGGNVCLALPAGPMISLGAALDATCILWRHDGGERQLPMFDFVLGPQQTALEPGEILRGIRFSRDALLRTTAFRRISLTPQGRSAALVIGTRDASGQVALTVTASTRRPQRISVPGAIDGASLATLVDATIASGDYHDDIHGRPEWRRHMTLLLAEEIVRELTGRSP